MSIYVCFAIGIKMVVPGGFEPPSQAPKAFRIDHYPTGLPMLILLYQDKLSA